MTPESFVKASQPAFLYLFGFIILILIIRILFDVLIPNWIHNWRNKRRFRAGKDWRSDRELLVWLQMMSPTDFENYIADLFSRLGYGARAVGKSHDGGVDVILEKDGVTSYIQCKKFITSVVPVGAVRDFYGALADHLVEGKGYFITTNRFTLEAEKFAESKPIELWNGFELVRYIHLAEGKAVSENSAVAEICPKCGGNITERNGKFGRFFGCSNYPRCTYTRSSN